MTEKPDELVSLAGRVLAAGNPLDNEQLMIELALYDSKDFREEALQTFFGPYFKNMLSLAGRVLGEEGDDIRDPVGETVILALETAWLTFAWYREQHLAKGTRDGGAKARRNADLAVQMGHALRKVAPSHRLFDPANKELGREPAFADSVQRVQDKPLEHALLGLLKHMHPQGTTWAHLAMATDARSSELTPLAKQLRDRGSVRVDDATVYASLPTMQDDAIEPLPWPPSEIS